MLINWQNWSQTRLISVTGRCHKEIRRDFNPYLRTGASRSSSNWREHGWLQREAGRWETQRIPRLRWRRLRATGDGDREAAAEGDLGGENWGFSRFCFPAHFQFSSARDRWTACWIGTKKPRRPSPKSSGDRAQPKIHGRAHGRLLANDFGQKTTNTVFSPVPNPSLLRLASAAATTSPIILWIQKF